MSTIQIAIADDQALFRKGMIAMLSTEDGFNTCLEAANGQELLDQLKQIQNFPDVILLDLRMPELNGIETTEILKKDYPDTKIVIVSLHDDADIIEYLFEKGANAYLDKNSEPEEVIRAIKDVHKHDFYFNATAKAALSIAAEASKKRIELLEEERISLREEEVLALICKEYTNAEIAEELALSPRTVEGHRLHLLQKSKSRNTAGLVLFAIKNGFINLSELKVS